MPRTLDPEKYIGKRVDALITPCLVIDANAMEHNLSLLARYFADRPAKIRPHFKSHKCVTLARRQIAAGSTTGITCAKLSEAEQLVQGGVDNVLIANQVVGSEKTRRLAELNRRAVVRAAVDSVENVDELAAAARQAGVTIGVLVEVDVGMGRCGVPPGEPALALARRVADSDDLRLDGLQGYEGHLVMVADPEERRRRVLETMRPLVQTRHLLTEAGLPVRMVSSAGTGTYDVTGNIEGIDEVQCGSYALMDGCYKNLRPEFKLACRVMTTVISAHDDRAVLDVGSKGLGREFGPPLVEDAPQAEVRGVAEEHTVIQGLKARVGSRVRLVSSHGCTTSNLYRRFWVARGDIIETAWPIEGSGCLE